MSAHVLPVRTYFAVFGALLLLTGATTAVAYVDLGGHWNDVVALTIACTKAGLVLLWFMHLRFSSRLIVLFAAAGLFWLLLLFTLTLADVLTRGPVPGWD